MEGSSQPSDEWDEDDFESYEPEDELWESKSSYVNKNAVIYLLDSGEKMFSQDSLIEGNIPFAHSLQCIRNSMRAKIWSSENALCSVILLGTNTSLNELNLRNISVVLPLRSLSADHILMVDEIAKKVNCSSYKTEYGSSTYSLADALWLSLKIMTERNMKVNKSMILFTNDDDPAKDNVNEFNRIISRIQDLCINNVIFDVIPLCENFNYNKIYKELIQMTRGDVNYVIPEDPSVKMKKMLKRANKKDYRHVPLAKIPFFVVDDYKCEVSVYYPVRKVKPPFRVKLSKATNERVKTRVQWFETDTGQTVRKEELTKVYTFAGKDIPITAEEFKHMEQFADKGLRLLGFKPASCINLEHYFQPCAFIYPGDPQNADGSAFFVALLMRCLKRQVVPICSFCPRSTSVVRFVALLAKEEEMADDGTQLNAAGFLAFFLPFAEEVRDLDDICTGNIRASEAQVKVAKKLINKLRFTYTPDMFPNPKLATHCSAVEALALNLKERETVVDATKPDKQMMRQRAQDVVEEFKDAIYSNDYDPEQEFLVKARPRKKTDRREGPAIDEEYVESIIKNGEANKLTNEILKEYLQLVGEGRGLGKMKKAELVERACRYLGVGTP